MNEFRFEYFVLNCDRNTKKPYMFNIFSNSIVQEHTEKAIKKYLENPSEYKYEPLFGNEKCIVGFDGLVKEIRGIIRWQEWGRVQYEIMVSDMFTLNSNKYEADKFTKIDCFQQCEPNMEMIVRECIYQYLKHKEKENE